MSFRLVHTNKIEFGDEVTVNLQVEPKAQIACITGTSTEVETLATFEQKVNETSACSIPVDEDANSEDSCQSDDEMNVSVTSWDMVGDSDEAIRENCATDLVEGIESQV